MNFEHWFATYKPVTNPHAADHGFGDLNFLFEAFGDDLERVDRTRKIDEALIWTLIEGESGDVIIEGYHWVNRLAYLIASVPHAGGQVDVPFG